MWEGGWAPPGSGTVPQEDFKRGYLLRRRPSDSIISFSLFSVGLEKTLVAVQLYTSRHAPAAIYPRNAQAQMPVAESKIQIGMPYGKA